MPIAVTPDERTIILETRINRYVQGGYRVVSRTATTAQLVKPKEFSGIIALALFLFFVLPFVIYLIAYAAEKEQSAYLVVMEDGTLSVNGEIERARTPRGPQPSDFSTEYLPAAGIVLLAGVMIALIGAAVAGPFAVKANFAAAFAGAAAVVLAVRRGRRIAWGVILGGTWLLTIYFYTQETQRAERATAKDKEVEAARESWNLTHHASVGDTDKTGASSRTP